MLAVRRCYTTILFLVSFLSFIIILLYAQHRLWLRIIPIQIIIFGICKYFNNNKIGRGDKKNSEMIDGGNWLLPDGGSVTTLYCGMCKVHVNRTHNYINITVVWSHHRTDSVFLQSVLFAFVYNPHVNQ